ncbi:amino acid ABC transporter permease [Campylobacter sp. MIT 99-7217]|uniref:amino acid ABC transporter permease n=1 Tax=Campylobacter sp. MIT 99-7217 TaxID=535091 RepID=UPI001159B3A9|nr:amino acid ABC transporter permease [Campylobacter sp. MIT 99-7217]TQR34573.1 amino acid ABC transporter permease [Campylobacter sp. MIT 99-7217]
MENVFNIQNLEFLFKGLVLSLIIALATCVISVILGTFLAITRNYGDKISRKLAAFYVEVFRNSPLLLWMLAAVFVLPSFFPLPSFISNDYASAFWGTIGFSLYTSSVMAEIIRGGLNSVPKGQFEAAYSQGFSSFFTLFYIILPQAFRKAIPSMLSQVVTTVKDTSFLAGLQIAELTYQSKILLAQLKSFEEILAMLALVATIYFVICFFLSVLVRYYEKKTAYAF